RSTIEFAFTSLPPAFILSAVKKGSVGPSTVRRAPPPRSYFLPGSAFSYRAPLWASASLYSSKKLVIDFALPFWFAGALLALAESLPAEALLPLAGRLPGDGVGTGVERSTPLSIIVLTLIP